MNYLPTENIAGTRICRTLFPEKHFLDAPPSQLFIRAFGQAVLLWMFLVDYSTQPVFVKEFKDA